MPWLAGTAYLHSVMIQERRGMLKVWNMLLVMIAFLLTIMGTFITRSGLVSSVHSFAQSAIGPWFGAFLVFLTLASLGLLLYRRSMLKSENTLDSLLSREAGFLLNNLILLGGAFTVLLGTFFPIVSEIVRGVKVSLGPPYFNAIMTPIGLALLLSGRRGTADRLEENESRSPGQGRCRSARTEPDGGDPPAHPRRPACLCARGPCHGPLRDGHDRHGVRARDSRPQEATAGSRSRSRSRA